MGTPPGSNWFTQEFTASDAVGVNANLANLNYPNPYNTLSPMTRAVMAASAPQSPAIWGQPIPGSRGANEALIAQHLVNLPEWRDETMRRVQESIYQRLKAEIQTGRVTVPSLTLGAIPREIPSDSVDVSQTVWTDFLRDADAFLVSAANGLKAIIDGIGPNAGPTLHVQDPMALRGQARLREAGSFFDLAPETFSAPQFLAAIVDTSRALADRAAELRGRIAPEKAEPTPEEKMEEWKDAADHEAYLMEGDKMVLEARNGPVSVYVIEQPESDGAHLVDISDEDTNLTPEEIERARDDADAFNLVDVPPGETVTPLPGREYRFRTSITANEDGSITADGPGTMGGNGQMGADE